jgi:hypothetical protein
MNLTPAEQQVLRALRECFPQAYFPEQAGGNKTLSHEQLVETRSILPRMVPADVLEWLPGVLYDLVIWRERFINEDGDLVIYFLDVLQKRDPVEEARLREAVEWFTKNLNETASKVPLERLLFEDLPQSIEFASSGEQASQDMLSREASFRAFTREQACIVCAWLDLARSWPETSLCGQEINSSLLYWARRCASQ